jgi:diguanylate cyclase (GGDEF)-like protein
LLETTRRLSVTDELTGLYNFRHFRERFMDESERAIRYSHNLSLLMCDIDYFKNYNDANGHEAGNEVLKKLAGLMAGSVRDVDFVARYGGEEFVILLVETGRDNAGIFAERLREKVEEEIFPYQKKQPGHNLTITIGIASFPQDAKTSEELIIRADQALYRGKKAGRNRVVSYSG